MNAATSANVKLERVSITVIGSPLSIRIRLSVTARTTPFEELHFHLQLNKRDLTMVV